MLGDKGLGSARQAERCLADGSWLIFGIRVEPFARAFGHVDTHPIHSLHDRLSIPVSGLQFHMPDSGRAK